MLGNFFKRLSTLTLQRTKRNLSRTQTYENLSYFKTPMQLILAEEELRALNGRENGGLFCNLASPSPHSASKYEMFLNIASKKKVYSPWKNVDKDDFN